LFPGYGELTRLRSVVAVLGIALLSGVEALGQVNVTQEHNNSSRNGVTSTRVLHYPARAVEKAFADAKKSLPINVDGAIGAILADVGMNPAAFNGIFMIARTPGLIAHVVEEQTRERPMRRIDPVNRGYDGPPARAVPTVICPESCFSTKKGLILNTLRLRIAAA